MFNLIKADIYRILRGKALWVTFGLLLTHSVFVGITGAIGTVGISTEETFEIAEMVAEVTSGSSIQLGNMSTGDLLFYFILPIIVMVVSVDFSNGAIRNVLSRGVSRVEYYLSKLLLAMLLSSFLMLLFLTMPMIVGTVFHGFGNVFETYSYFRIVLTQLPVYYAVVSIGTFIALTLKKTAVLNAVYIPMFIVAQIILSIIMYNSNSFDFLANYELGLLLSKYVGVEVITNSNILSTFIYTICVIIGTTGLGIFLFNKSEIK